MSDKKLQKLELTWIGKDKRPRLEPRVLVEDKEKSHHAATRRRDGKDIFDNMLIHGDNLLALKALEQQFTGKVKCIYIDPPYNTGNAFEYYDDGLEHSIWLGLMSERFRLLYVLLAPDGMFWIQLDDSEVHYCKVVLDEIFGRENFVAHITYERSGVAGLGQGGWLVNTTEHILAYKKGELPTKNNLSYEQLGLNIIKRYNKYVSSFGNRKLVRTFVAKSNGEEVKVYEHEGFAISSISLKDVKTNELEVRHQFAEHLDVLFRGNRVQKENEFQNDIIAELEKGKFYSVDYIPSRGKHEGEPTTLYYYNKELLSWLRDTTSLSDGGELVKSQKMTTLWKHGEIPKADIANEGGVYFPRGKKPEQLLRRILEMSTNPGDLVLDSFLGSGTTAAVAHKMGRRWIGVELGDHCYTHCKVRLDKVIDGEDPGGITKAVGWKGGGGYRFFELAPTLITKDKWGQEVINKDYNPTMLAEAVCKLEGYTYAPSETEYFIHGHSTEKSFIYVTTNFIRKAELDDISEQVGGKRSLLICCKGFDRGASCANVRLKKIPEAVLKKCEWGHDDYSLNVANLPMSQDVEYVQDDFFGEG